MTESDNSPDLSQKNRSHSKSPERKKQKREDSSPKSKSRRHKRRSKSKERDDEKRDKRHHKEHDKPAKYPRYYGEEVEKKKNSDRYWNKYAQDQEEEVQIGKRYYDEGKDRSKNEKSNTEEKEGKAEDKSEIKPRERKTVDLLTKTGGAYIPPAKLRMMQAEITDKSSAAYQRIAWEALKKSVHGYINKVNTSNIAIIAKELLHENIVRGRGLLCKSIIQAQAASPTFTNVYAALVAIINSKFPNIGELLLKRLVLQFKRGFKQNNKVLCISSATFIAHLVNQRIAHEILALEILTLLVESPTDDSVEVAISFLKECGQKLTEVSSKGIDAIFTMLRNILHEGQLEKRIQYMIEVMFQIRKDGFKDHEAVITELDLVEEEDQFTHLITLDDVIQSNSEDILNVFKFDDKYEENEGKYKLLSKEILGSDSESGSGTEGSGEESDDEEDEEDEEKEKDKIIDNTDTNLIVLRRTIYLTIQSSLDFEECAHKLMKMELKPGQEIELCHMFLDCCAEQRTYEKFYGLLAQRFCQINQVYVEPFQQIFKDTYATTHRLDANRLRNVSKFFAHLLFTDAIGWEVLAIMRLTEEDTNSSSRIFIKILFQELAEYMSLGKLNKRLKDPTMQEHFTGLFPRDNPKNTRFSINFFTSIGLGGLTDELREHLKNVPKTPTITVPNDSTSSDSSSSSDSTSTSSCSSSSDSSDSSSEGEKSKKKEKPRTKNHEIKEKNKRPRNRSSERADRKRDDLTRKDKNKRNEEDKDKSSRRHEKKRRSSSRERYNSETISKEKHREKTRDSSRRKPDRETRKKT